MEAACWGSLWVRSFFHTFCSPSDHTPAGCQTGSDFWNLHQHHDNPREGRIIVEWLEEHQLLHSNCIGTRLLFPETYSQSQRVAQQEPLQPRLFEAVQTASAKRPLPWWAPPQEGRSSVAWPRMAAVWQCRKSRNHLQLSTCPAASHAEKRLSECRWTNSRDVKVCLCVYIEYMAL